MKGESNAPRIPGWLEEAYPFHRRVLRIGSYRVHFVDQGEGPTVLMLHGNPTWSFLWRRVTERLLAGGGVRVVAPDLVGFGLSDKPRLVRSHSLEMHIRTIAELIEALDLTDITVVGQDWGGPIAAGAAARSGDRVQAAAFGNTALLAPRRPLQPTLFHRASHWPVLSDATFRGLGFPLPFLGLMQGESRSIGRLERRAYRYPFRRVRDRAGPLALARMVPNREGHPALEELERVDRWIRGFRGPISLVWGIRDPLLGRARNRLREALPEARYLETRAGHFLQEEVPHVLASEILAITGPEARRQHGG